MPTKTAAPVEWVALTAVHVRGSRHREIHTARDDLTRELLAQIPGYPGLRAMMRRIVDFTPATVKPVLPGDVLRDRILELAADGEQIPDNLADAIPGVGAIPDGPSIGFAANAVEVAASRLVGAAHEAARVQVLQDLDSALDAGASRFLAGITDNLVGLVDEARQVLTGRGRIGSAEQAIAEDRAAEWQAHARFGQQYADLRRAYGKWYEIASGGQVVPSGPDAYSWAIRNPLHAVGTDLLRLLAKEAYAFDADEKAYLAGGMWELPWQGTDWDSPDALWWFAAFPAAVPWAPSPEQYVALRQDINTGVTRFARGCRRVTPKASR